MTGEVIRYNGWIIDDDGDILPVHKSFSPEKQFVKTYRSILYKLMGVQGCPRDLYEYLLFTMDEECTIHHNQVYRDKFIEFMQTECGVSYSTPSVNKAFETLVAKGLIARVTRGMYKVSEKFASNREESARVQGIKIELDMSEKEKVMTIKAKFKK